MSWRSTEKELARFESTMSWLEENAPTSPLASVDTVEGAQQHREWERTLFDAGLAEISWPSQYGGQDADVTEWLAFEEAYYRFGAPGRVNQNGLYLFGPSMLRVGTPEQRERFLTATAAGEILWAQAWSEPDSGSDLASLRSRADRVAGGWRLNGQKTWSTRAAVADWAFGLFRTDRDAPRHRGLTYFLIPLDAPGVTVRPIARLNGDPGFGEIFFEDVFVSDDDLLGSPGEGWKIAMSTAGDERGITLRSPGRYIATAEALLRLEEELEATGDEVTAACLSAESYRIFTYASVGKALAGTQVSGSSSLNKLLWSRTDIELHEAAMGVLGPEAVTNTAQNRWLDGYQFSLSGPIYAGTNEIQKNIIGERLLGLPR